jgi:hypothetical protein
MIVNGFRLSDSASAGEYGVRPQPDVPQAEYVGRYVVGSGVGAKRLPVSCRGEVFGVAAYLISPRLAGGQAPVARRMNAAKDLRSGTASLAQAW